MFRNQSRTTKHSCHMSWEVVKNHETFPLPILKKLGELDQTLREWGLGAAGLMICGDKITVGISGGVRDQYVIKPHEDNTPWREQLVTKMWEDKAVPITLMCVIIVLEREGYIKAVNVNGVEEDGENKELWETAWSIILSMSKEDNK